MSWIREYAQGFLTKGQIGPAWYAVLTGVVMLFLAYVLGTAYETDPFMAPYAAGVLSVTGVWSLASGCRRLYLGRLGSLSS